MSKIIESLLVGLVVGIVFGSMDLPIPAPRVLAGVMGIAGIYGGYTLINLVMQNWDKIVNFLGF